MSVPRRQLLQFLSFTFGSSFVPFRNKFAMAAQSSAQSASPAPQAKEAAKHPLGGPPMEKVAGVGGLFFRARDPKALGKCYEEHLGTSLTPTSAGGSAWQQEAGPTAFSPFPETSKYFGDASKVWMVNFRVDDMAKMVAQLRAAGIEVKDPESYPGLGSFTRLHDPEGNPIELWQPA